MANTNKQFQEYNDELKIPKSKRDAMIVSRKDGRNRIEKWFAENQPDYPVSFWIQGSHKNHLNIRTRDEDCDLEESDPQEFTEWLDEQVENHGDQLRRTIKYLKGWADHISRNHKMLNGLTLTVLACDNFEEVADRDDKALYFTLIGIYNGLNAKWECIMPATPGDDLLERYDSVFKKNFINALADLINDAKKALNEESKNKASKLWKKHLGKRYPLATLPVTQGNRAALGSLIGNNKPYFDGTRGVS